MCGTVSGPDKYHLGQIRFKIECPLWIELELMVIQMGLFGLLGAKSVLKAILKLRLKCDIDQESSLDSLKSPPFHAKGHVM